MGLALFIAAVLAFGVFALALDLAGWIMARPARRARARHRAAMALPPVPPFTDRWADDRAARPRSPQP